MRGEVDRRFNTAKQAEYIKVTSKAKNGINYLDSELEAGYPVLVGVDHHYQYKGGFNNDLSTDHFIVIVGRGYDEKGLFYRFYEVGTSHKDKGASDENKLYLTNNILKGKTAYKPDRDYVVTQIRKNLSYD